VCFENLGTICISVPPLQIPGDSSPQSPRDSHPRVCVFAIVKYVTRRRAVVAAIYCCGMQCSLGIELTVGVEIISAVGHVGVSE